MPHILCPNWNWMTNPQNSLTGKSLKDYNWYLWIMSQRKLQDCWIERKFMHRIFNKYMIYLSVSVDSESFWAKGFCKFYGNPGPRRHRWHIFNSSFPVTQPVCKPQMANVTLIFWSNYQMGSQIQKLLWGPEWRRVQCKTAWDIEAYSGLYPSILITESKDWLLMRMIIIMELTKGPQQKEIKEYWYLAQDYIW